MASPGPRLQRLDYGLLLFEATAEPGRGLAHNRSSTMARAAYVACAAAFTWGVYAGGMYMLKPDLPPLVNSGLLGDYKVDCTELLDNFHPERPGSEKLNPSLLEVRHGIGVYFESNGQFSYAHNIYRQYAEGLTTNECENYLFENPTVPPGQIFNVAVTNRPVAGNAGEFQIVVQLSEAAG